MKGFMINNIKVGDNSPFIFIGGPCVIESEEVVMRTAERIRNITVKAEIPFIFKASFDKANRLSIESYRGPGIEEGLRILDKVKRTFDVTVLTDVHSVEQVEPAAEVVDVLQVPAFLSRQTDLLSACGSAGKPVLIKKGQFMAPEDMKHSARKVREGGSERVLLCERGVSFGYHNLVVDMRSLVIMREDSPVIFDATHSVQIPGGSGNTSGGAPSFVPPLARAAVAVGVDGIFAETHPNPAEAMCDSSNMLPLDELEGLLISLREIDIIVKS